jgi:hypothetical protein
MVARKTRKNPRALNLEIKNNIRRNQRVKTMGKGRYTPKQRNTKKTVTKKTVTKKVNKTPTMVSISKNTVIIKDQTPFSERLVSRSIHQVVKRNKKKGLMPAIDELIPLVRSDLVASKSFSPEVNKVLVSINNKSSASNIFGCGLAAPLKGKVFKPNKARNDNSLFKQTMSINIGKGDKKECVDRTDPRAQEMLLDNLKASSKITCSNIIMPVQLQANCWFNTMFACMFISDKGRKFFRFFRQMMIEGKLSNGVLIAPQKLSDSFFLLNAAVEASYNSTNDDNVKNLALVMDTNNIITRIYNSIPKSKRGSSVLDVNSANNPLSYYNDIISYLGNPSISFVRLDYSSFNNLITNNVAGKADIYAVEFMDDQSKQFSERPMSFFLHGSKYVLDSAIIRDVDMFHFCAVITCDDVEYGYDGASMSRLNKFGWKKYINKDKEWTFEGSNFNEDKKTPILWNFRSSYQILFYYRQN